MWEKNWYSEGFVLNKGSNDMVMIGIPLTISPFPPPLKDIFILEKIIKGKEVEKNRVGLGIFPNTNL